MGLPESFRAVRTVVSETRGFNNLGLPLFWYFIFHYRGRWNDRHAIPYPEETVELKYMNRRFRFSLTWAYAGAMKGIFLDEEYALRDALPVPPRRILDLGANIGMAAAALAAQFPAAEFLFVEPDPRNIKRLERTINWNSLEGRIVACAVGSQGGRLRLRMGSNPTCSALETSKMHVLPDAIEVEVQTVGELLAEVGWETVDLVKIDIEGIEEELLTVNNNWLERVGAMVMEIHPACSPETIGRAIAKFGFELRTHGTGREPVYVAIR